MNLLVIGGGSIGQRHLRNLKTVPGVTVEACTRNAAVGPMLEVRTYKALADVWESRPAAAVIANATNEHMPAALAAAQRGCHLLIEKPLSHALEGIAELKEARDRRNLVALVGCNMRFHPALRAVKRALDDKAVGRVLAVEAHCGSYLPDWRPHRDYRASYSSRETQGGGVVLDLIHELDYLYWFFGEARAVAAFVDHRSPLELDCEDVADILLRFECGLVAQVHLDYVQRPPTRGCRIVGEDGTIVWNDEQGQVVLLKPGLPDRVLWVAPVGYDRNDMYMDEAHHFLDCIRTGKAPLIGLEDGEAVLGIALAAKTASRDGRVVVL